ncbi:hypothetical protein [Cryobacterium arcticum]|uniref:Uncharacterized protein n=1 Tax=Cryobacterium arcticum TaxID=670052 RepID=A0A1B1BPQ5_9MICO|nr:hypothetical protein [Cryobacterium arcticum]ANP74547.1 hypothetical protein PA27867_3629 [Cryobacterium arcticum]
MQRDILGRNAEKDQAVKTRNLGTTPTLRSTSVTDGHTEFNGNESLLVKGSQKVSGWLIVTGTLKVVGAFLLEGATTMTGNLISSGTALFTGAFTSRGTTRFEGDTTQQGPLHVVGASDFTGDVDMAGLLKILGNVLLTGDVVVGPGGEITIAGSAPITLGVGPNGLPALYFGSGASLEGTSTGARMVSSGSPYVEASTNSAQLVSGSRAVRVTDGATFASGLTESANAANVYIDSAGRLFKATG